MTPRAVHLEPSQPPLILVVDDLDVNRKIRCALLENAGYRVSEAKNGAQALREAVTKRPDLVLSDILMPVMDGFELCRAWKADPKLQSIPFVFYSATYTGTQDQDFAKRLGADAFLRKGADSDELLRQIGDLIEAPRHAPNRPASGVNEEGAFYRQHSERVVRKLEDKLHELERANEEIRAREEQLRAAKRELERRVGERTAELLASNKELEAFAYTVSHDLRAPLRSIRARSRDSLERFQGQVPQAMLDNVAAMDDAARRMSRLIDELLELSRVARRALNREPVDLSSLAREVVDELLSAMPQRNVQVRIAPGMTATADRPLLRSALSNLFDNAFKYTSLEAQARVTFDSRVEQGVTIFSVRDNGVGFEQHQAGHLFKPFQRLHTEEQFAGTGIGLATVARIIHRHGGGVWAEGVRGEGAVFCFSLPRG